VSRRLLLKAAAASLASGAVAGLQAQPAWPQKQIRIVVPFPAGGIADQFARIIGGKLADTWGQPVVIENRAGAGGNIGADVVAKSPPDGYNLVMGSIGTHAVNAALFKNMPYDIAKDFTPIALVIEAEGLLVTPVGLEVRSVKDIVDAARAQPSKLSYASAGVGTTSHLAGELFKSMAKVDLTHVPYKGNVPAITDLIGGQTSMLFATMPTAMPHVRAGKLRAIAVIGKERSPALPDVPTVAEAALPGFDASNWIGLFGPAGLPADITNKLNGEVLRILRMPEIQTRLASEGARFTATTPSEFAGFVRAESAKWTKVVRDAGIKPE
jgi:tripartite-type tricarboxylate transporter receptor subunit TctC